MSRTLLHAFQIQKLPNMCLLIDWLVYSSTCNIFYISNFFLKSNSLPGIDLRSNAPQQDSNIPGLLCILLLQWMCNQSVINERTQTISLFKNIFHLLNSCIWLNSILVFSGTWCVMMSISPAWQQLYISAVSCWVASSLDTSAICWDEGP